MSVRMMWSSPSLIRPIAIPATARLSGTPASISDSVDPQTEAIDEEPLDSRMSDTTRIVYGNSSWLGIIGTSARSASAPWPMSRRLGPRMKPASPTENGGEGEVGGVAALGTAHEAGLPDRERREVVVVEVSLGGFQPQRVQPHLLTCGAQRHDAEGLRLTAREHRRAVGAGSDADLDRDRPDLLRAAAVGTLLVDRDALADQRLLQLVERALRIASVFREGLRLGIARVMGEHLLLHRLAGILALELVLDLGGGLQCGAVRGLDLLVELRADLRHVDLDLGLAPLRGELALDAAELLDRLVGDVERIEDLGFRDLVGARLDHQDRLFGTRDDQVQVGALGQVLLGWVDDEVAVDLADSHRADRRREWDVGDHQGRRGTVQRQHVVRMDVVHRHRQRHELGLIAPALGEQRSNRTIDQARRERRLLPRAPFALEKRAGNLPGRVHALFDIHGERQKVNIAEVAARRGTEDHRVARADDDGAGGLFGQLAGLERDLFALDLDGDARNGVRHIQLPSLLRPSVGGVLFLFFYSERR